MDTDLSEEQLKYLQNIKHTSDILLALVSDILDITKITQGKMEPSFRESRSWENRSMSMHRPWPSALPKKG